MLGVAAGILGMSRHWADSNSNLKYHTAEWNDYLDERGLAETTHNKFFDLGFTYGHTLAEARGMTKYEDKIFTEDIVRKMAIALTPAAMPEFERLRNYEPEPILYSQGCGAGSHADVYIPCK